MDTVLAIIAFVAALVALLRALIFADMKRLPGPILKKKKKKKKKEKATREPVEPLPSHRESEHYVEIYYATDRQFDRHKNGSGAFLNERAQTSELSFGRCWVTIPKHAHQLGRLESPSILKLQFTAKAHKHVVLERIDRIASNDFYAAIRGQAAQSEQKEAFVFVHGYNVSFDAAAKRTAQLAFDLAFKGAPILYSWPSRGRWYRYPSDEDSVKWTVPHLRLFLEHLAGLDGISTIHVIAHQALMYTHQAAPRFRHVVLTAPDIDVDVFRGLATALKLAANRVTVYTSRWDRALLLSYLFHGYKRTGSSVVVIPGIDTIDASTTDTSLLGLRHSYFGQSRSVLADLYALLTSDLPPPKRFGISEMTNDSGTYYVFRL